MEMFHPRQAVGGQGRPPQRRSAAEQQRLRTCGRRNESRRRSMRRAGRQVRHACLGTHPVGRLTLTLWATARRHGAALGAAAPKAAKGEGEANSNIQLMYEYLHKV
jgi:hypothetical protein